LGVATTGIALSVAFSNAENSPLPLVLVALLDLVFLAIEARRYRYFDISGAPAGDRWRFQCTARFSDSKGTGVDNGWNEALALNLRAASLSHKLLEAMGRRLRRNYSFVFVIQAAAT
jgi:uncharacterized membrane protein